jgi:hypothetical protein
MESVRTGCRRAPAARRALWRHCSLLSRLPFAGKSTLINQLQPKLCQAYAKVDLVEPVKKGSSPEVRWRHLSSPGPGCCRRVALTRLSASAAASAPSDHLSADLSPSAPAASASASSPLPPPFAGRRRGAADRALLAAPACAPDHRNPQVGRAPRRQSGRRGGAYRGRSAQWTAVGASRPRGPLPRSAAHLQIRGPMLTRSQQPRHPCLLACWRPVLTRTRVAHAHSRSSTCGCGHRYCARRSASARGKDWLYLRPAYRTHLSSPPSLLRRQVHAQPSAPAACRDPAGSLARDVPSTERRVGPHSCRASGAPPAQPSAMSARAISAPPLRRSSQTLGAGAPF